MSAPLNPGLCRFRKECSEDDQSAAFSIFSPKISSEYRSHSGGSRFDQLADAFIVILLNPSSSASARS